MYGLFNFNMFYSIYTLKIFLYIIKFKSADRKLNWFIAIQGNLQDALIDFKCSVKLNLISIACFSRKPFKFVLRKQKNGKIKHFYVHTHTPI